MSRSIPPPESTLRGEVRIEEWRPELPGGGDSERGDSQGGAPEGRAPVDGHRDAHASGGRASFDRDLDMLSDVLHAVVHSGAGVSFIVPFSLDEARAFWEERVWPGVRAGTRRVVVARCDGRIVGTVQLDLAQPPNQQHRGEIAKLLVHPIARRRGIARALMIAIEAIARAEGKTLLTLDTWTGGAAEQLYRSLGYVVAGVIPRFARGSTTTALEPTTIMYKDLSAG